MMKIEAECLLGREMDDEEFELLNHVYMESSLDKKTVCEAWKGQKDTSVLVDLADKVARFQEEYSKLAASHRDLFAIVKRNQDLLERAEWVNIKMLGRYLWFNRDLMKCVVFGKHLESCFNARLFNVPDCHRRLKYESKTPMPKEALDLLALMGYVVEGPL